MSSNMTNPLPMSEEEDHNMIKEVVAQAKEILSTEEKNRKALSLRKKIEEMLLLIQYPFGVEELAVNDISKEVSKLEAEYGVLEYRDRYRLIDHNLFLLSDVNNDPYFILFLIRESVTTVSSATWSVADKMLVGAMFDGEFLQKHSHFLKKNIGELWTIEYLFVGLIPPELRAEIRAKKEDFDDIFVITGPRQESSIVAGLKFGHFWLMGEFDGTSVKMIKTAKNGLQV